MSSMTNKEAILNQIENKPLRERIADILRTSILKAELKPGDPIVESTLATQLGVSRAPLREALQILNTEGLIEIIPYHKTTVRKLFARDIEEVYSLRSVLESFAISQIIERGDPQSIHILNQICSDMVEAADAGRTEEVSELDHRFHDTIIQESDHNVLIATWSNISQRVRQILALRDMRRKDVSQMARSHQPIVDAIAAGETELAGKLMDEHIATASDFVVDVWEKQYTSKKEAKD